MAENAAQRGRWFVTEVGVGLDEADGEGAIRMKGDGLWLVAVKPAIFGEDNDLFHITLTGVHEGTSIRRTQREGDFATVFGGLGFPGIAGSF